MDSAPPSSTTPHAVRLVPHAVLLRRSRTELQVGVDPSVVVPEGYAGLVRELTSGVPRTRLDELADQAGLPPEAVPDLLVALEQAGLLRHDLPTPTRAVRVVGSGPLGAGTADELASAGFGRVYLADLPGTGGPGPAARPSAADRPARADLVTAVLQSSHPGVEVRRTRHFAKPEGDAVALTVVVADGPEPDRLVTDVLRDHGAPHLLVRCSGDEATVGPLVVPGTTSCVRCADLARRDADPRWPWLLEQLTRVHRQPTPTLLTWAAVTAAVQALAFVARGHAETVGHTLELGSPEHTLRLRAWAPHPECPCRWDGTTDPAGPPDHGRG